jgi:hypothetical protein
MRVWGPPHYTLFHFSSFQLTRPSQATMAKSAVRNSSVLELRYVFYDFNDFYDLNGFLSCRRP